METASSRPAAFQPAPRTKLGAIVLLVILMHVAIIAMFFMHFSWQLGEDDGGQSGLGQTGIVIPVTLEAKDDATEQTAEPSPEPAPNPVKEPAPEADNKTTSAPESKPDPAPEPASEPASAPPSDPLNTSAAESVQENPTSQPSPPTTLSNEEARPEMVTNNEPVVVPEITLEATASQDPALTPNQEVSTLPSTPPLPLPLPPTSPIPIPPPPPTTTTTTLTPPAPPAPPPVASTSATAKESHSGTPSQAFSATINPVQAVTEARIDPDYLHRPDPVYPPLSKRRQEQGKVLLRVGLDEKGAVISISVERTSGFDRLDQSALEAVAQWRFLPAKRGQEAIPSTVQVPIEFKYQQ